MFGVELPLGSAFLVAVGQNFEGLPYCVQPGLNVFFILPLALLSIYHEFSFIHFYWLWESLPHQHTLLTLEHVSIFLY